jgi:Late embryogenesis abundant protein
MGPAPRTVLFALLFSLTVSACASLEGLRGLIQAPQFEQARDRQSEIHLLPVQAGRPAGGATIRLWATVSNPNPFGFTLSTVDATMLLEGIEAAGASFPLGLPLQARQSETIPLDLTVSFANVPRLASVLRQAASGQSVGYTLEGTVGVEAGRFGQPTFGPMTLLTGELRTGSRVLKF